MKAGAPRAARAPSLYFAFGSNLDAAQMALRCPGARQIGTATLPDHTLVFAGASASRGGAVATIIRLRGGIVAGAVYRVTKAHLARLDRFEGVPTFYERRRVTVEVAGVPRRATTYVLRREQFFLGLPAADYLGQITGAYRALGLPLRRLTTALAISQAVEDPNGR